MKKKLYLITETFPYGSGEKPFLIPELEELVKRYDITIISHAHKAELNDDANRTNLDTAIKVVNVDIKLQWYKRIKYAGKYFCSKDGLREALLILKNKRCIWYRLYQSIGFFALGLENMRLMRKKKILTKDTDSIYYSYWYFYYTYSITHCKEMFPHMKVVTRTHGFDLYGERYNGGRQPFKEIMDENLDRVIFISAQGKRYYLSRYNKTNEKKYVVSRIGTIESDRKNGVPSTRKFRIVSCSSIIPLKRVNLIVDALNLLKEELEWVHFGGGTDYDNIIELSDRKLKPKQNITYEIRGNVPNKEVLQFYSENYVNCFISTSSTEGLPVSIQEAMSFGIPIIATDVGGVSELFDNNGILLSNNPTKEEVAEAIEKIVYLDENEYATLRNNSYRLWKRDYNSEVNRVNFCEILEKL